MAFLSRLFGGRGERDRWYVKVDLITELSEIARKYWRAEWAALADPTRAETDEASFDAAAEHAFARFQAARVLDFIAERQYLGPDERADFDAFLLRSMIGVDAGRAEPALAADAFALAMARAAGAPDTAGAAVAIREALPGCVLEQQYITALAFGDGDTARRLRAAIEGDAGDGE